jgi:hypothetical protein
LPSLAATRARFGSTLNALENKQSIFTISLFIISHLFSNESNEFDIPVIWSFTWAKINLRIRNKNPPVANATVIGTPTD